MEGSRWTLGLGTSQRAGASLGTDVNLRWEIRKAVRAAALQGAKSTVTEARSVRRFPVRIEANEPGCAAGSVVLATSDCEKRLPFCVRARQDLRLSWPVILFRGLPARFGSLRRFQADSRAGSARDEKKPAVVMSKTYTDLQDFYGSDGTRTRDLRRDRLVPEKRRLATIAAQSLY